MVKINSLCNVFWDSFATMLHEMMKKLKTIEIERLDTDAFRAVRKVPITVVLDSVRSMNNVGAVFRTADAFRIDQVMLCGITACPPHPDIHKTALGAEESMTWCYRASAEEAVTELKSAGVRVYALEQATDSISLETFQVDTSLQYALVLGNEVKGVRQSVIDLCDGCIEIPQYGTKHSLNVSVAAGITMWHLSHPFFEDL